MSGNPVHDNVNSNSSKNKKVFYWKESVIKVTLIEES